MYNLIYDFIVDNLLSNTRLSQLHAEVLGIDLTFQEYLGHTATIIIIGIIIAILCLFVRWIYRLFAGLLANR